MAYRSIITVTRGDQSLDLVVLDEAGQEQQILRAALAAPLRLGPAFGEQLIAAGIGAGIAWSQNKVRFDPERVGASAQITLAGVVVAHDPETLASPNPRATALAALEAQASAIQSGTGNQTTAAKRFAADFLAWAADSVERG